MDPDWTFSSCSWLWEEDTEYNNTCNNTCTDSSWTWEENKAFENALAAHFEDTDLWDKIAAAVPGKTVEELKLRYDTLLEDVEAIELGKVQLPRYADEKEKKHRFVRRGKLWTEEEHRLFLHGLSQFGRGNWKSIAKFCVTTKTNSQVASHAQKYFERMSSFDKRKRRPSINDITIEDQSNGSIPPLPNQETGNGTKPPLPNQETSSSAPMEVSSMYESGIFSPCSSTFPFTPEMMDLDACFMSDASIF